MSISSFIPTLWSARLLENLNKSQVATAFINRDYEGEIKNAGQTLKINSIGDITIGTYAGTSIGSPEALSTSAQELTIDQKKYFNFAIDDVDKVQAAGMIMDSAMARAAYNLADVADKYIFSTIKTSATTANATADTAEKLTASNIYEKIIGMRLLLDKANAPTVGRGLAVCPDAYALLLQDDRFVKTGGSMAESTLANGIVGNIAGFTVYETNNLPYVAAVSGSSGTPEEFTLVAGHNMGATYADQILQTEAYRPEALFSDAIKGLQVYGMKVTRPTCFVKYQAKFA